MDAHIGKVLHLAHLDAAVLAHDEAGQGKVLLGLSDRHRGE
ncbi:MAG: hypothetical protein ACKV1O_07140 [Saprospiraceae bacterium]